MKRETIFSSDRVYRYTLWREFETAYLFDGGNRMKDGYVQFIGLNPSTADEVQDDPTIRRCIRFAKDWGYGAMCMTNLFPFRATDPEEMRSHHTEENFEAILAYTVNITHIRTIALGTSLIVAAWGTHGCHLDAGNSLKEYLRKEGLKLHHLGLNEDRSPKHPLYLKATTKPVLWI